VIRARKFVCICPWPNSDICHAASYKSNRYGPATSVELRERIVHWFYDFELPVKDIVLLSGRSQSTIYAILQMYDTYGEVTIPLANRTGRKRILDANDLRYIQSILEARPITYLDEIQEKLFQNREILVSLATLSRTLRRLRCRTKGSQRSSGER